MDEEHVVDGQLQLDVQLQGVQGVHDPQELTLEQAHSAV